MATSIRLDPAIEQRLDHLAATTGRSKAFYLRELVERGLEDLEDYYLADAIMERVRTGEEPTYSLEDVERELGLADRTDRRGEEAARLLGWPQSRKLPTSSQGGC